MSGWTIWGKRKQMTREQAVMQAIDASEYGDTVVIHGKGCTNPHLCECDPVEVTIGGRPAKAPLGFRVRNERS